MKTAFEIGFQKQSGAYGTDDNELNVPFSPPGAVTDGSQAQTENVRRRTPLNPPISMDTQEGSSSGFRKEAYADEPLTNEFLPPGSPNNPSGGTIEKDSRKRPPLSDVGPDQVPPVAYEPQNLNSFYTGDERKYAMTKEDNTARNVGLTGVGVAGAGALSHGAALPIAVKRFHNAFDRDDLQKYSLGGRRFSAEGNAKGVKDAVSSFRDMRLMRGAGKALMIGGGLTAATGAILGLTKKHKDQEKQAFELAKGYDNPKNEKDLRVVRGVTPKGVHISRSYKPDQENNPNLRKFEDAPEKTAGVLSETVGTALWAPGIIPIATGIGGLASGGYKDSEKAEVEGRGLSNILIPGVGSYRLGRRIAGQAHKHTEKTAFERGFEKKAYDYDYEAEEHEQDADEWSKKDPADYPKSMLTGGGIGGLLGLGIGGIAGGARGAALGALIGGASGVGLGAATSLGHNLSREEGKRVMAMEPKKRELYLKALSRQNEQAMNRAAMYHAAHMSNMYNRSYNDRY